MLKMMLIAGLGGFVGTCGRFLVGRLCGALLPLSFPFGTFAVNVVGCFVIGIAYGLLDRGNVLSAGQGVALITGFCGGFTTFSAFAGEIWSMGNRGEWATALAYVAASVIVGVAMVWLGRMVVAAR